ncbi:hypothetical protein JRQ81_015019 [Phrynocephalus forsythii]|uniref:Uncharacterized protein n=1 Tax=Phrynocephalus forsythii TaxID=171643 RepID=A0A9Q0XXT6_9SAUR|nr:hypothetical protein JRQ81_015019 [Phrynocephalus forsythii]
MKLSRVHRDLARDLAKFMDTQHSAGEGIPTETGEGTSNHRPHQWNLKRHSHCAEGHSHTCIQLRTGAARGLRQGSQLL